MPRTIPLALLTALLATPAPAQIVPPREGNENLAPLFVQEGAIVDLIRLWSIDMNGDGTDERFVQVAYAPAGGGNAWWLQFFVLPPEGQGDIPREVALDTAGIEEVSMTPDGPVAVTMHYAGDDGHCCPTLRDTASLRLRDLPPA